MATFLRYFEHLPVHACHVESNVIIVSDKKFVSILKSRLLPNSWNVGGGRELLS